jgi:hypothetical protein
VILDSRGEAAIYFVGDYDVVLKDSAGSTIWGPERLSQPWVTAADLIAADGDELIGWSGIYSIFNGTLTSHASLAAAVTAIGSNRCTVVVRKDTTMAANATFPSTATLRVENRAQITTTSYTLTLGAKPQLHDGQCFAGTGTVAFASAAAVPDEVMPEWWGAIADGSTDNVTAINACIAAVNAAGGGTVRFGPGDYRHSTPIKTFTDVRLLGSGEGATFLTKTGNGTLALSGADATASNATLVCLGLAKLSDGSGNVNCSIWVSASVRGLNVEIAYMTIQSTGTSATGSPVRIGLAGIGLSDSTLHDLCFNYYSIAAIALPVMFFGEVYKTKYYRCVQGLAIEAGTSLSVRDNYAIYCQKSGYYLRDMSYLTITNNACDGLNNVSNASDYSDRTVDSKCYVLDACTGVQMTANGAESCFGSHVYIDSCESAAVTRNNFRGPASSYTGANQVALFYVAQLAHDVHIEDNIILRGGVTAVQGAANAANHHDLYVSVASENQGFRYRNNWTANNEFDAPSTIFGNMVPTYLSNLKQGACARGDFTPAMALSGATGVSISYGSNNKGRYEIVEGWMHVDIALDVSSVSYTGTSDITVSGLIIANKAAKDARLLVDQSANVTWPSTESYFLTIATTATSGTIKNRTDGTTLGVAGAFASGATNVYLHISGRVYVGDLVNIV